MVFRILNIQGLSKVKAKEMEELVDKNSLLCLTETQKKIRDINFNNSFTIIEGMRELDDRKGGGLLLLYMKDNGLICSKVETRNRDILCVNGNMRGWDFMLILVYFSVNDKARNLSIRDEIEKIIENLNEDFPLIVTGDFNGHVGFKGEQKLDENGKMIIEWMEKYKLTMLNDDVKCQGEYTWRRENQKSIIDYALVSNGFYNRFLEMKIDEDQELVDISDHNLIEIKMKTSKKVKYTRNEWVEREYYKRDKEALTGYKAELERKVNNKEIRCIQELEDTIKEVANRTLKRVYKRKIVEGQERDEEPPWFTEQIRAEIKERRRFNRNRRNAISEEEKNRWKIQYEQQKSRVQLLIRKEIYVHEEKIVEEIKKDKSNGKNTWKYIKMLKGGSTKERGNYMEHMFKDDGGEVNKEDRKEEVEKFWGKIYGKHNNEISKVWNDECKEKYKRCREVVKNRLEGIRVGIVIGEEPEEEDQNENEIYHREIREHLDMAMTMNSTVRHIEDEIINIDRVRSYLKKMKGRRASGPDDIKPEFYKAFLESDTLMQLLVKLLKELITTGSIPEGWKESKTVLIPKTRKPKVHEFRPIALTNIGYKIAMAVVRMSIEDHVEINRWVKDTQAGFTKGGRIENNIFILKYCIERTFERKKTLVVISIDYTKAFDSIKRDKMIEVLIDHWISPDVIDIIAKLYEGDKTIVKIAEGEEVDIPVTSGIRQGCTGSTTLFKLVTYKIMKKLEELNLGYKDETFKITSLFFADDGMLLAEGLEDAETVIEEVVNTSRECGLEINKQKSNIIIFNKKDKPQEIAGIKVADRIKYLGLTINDSKNCFKIQKEQIIGKARKCANMAYSVVARSCSRLLIGKTFWKCVALPAIMYGANIIEFTKQEIRQLQRIENSVGRQILGAERYSQEAAIRGEIGISSMKARIMEGQIKYLQYILRGEGNELLERIVEEMKEKKRNRWIKGLIEDRRMVGIKGRNVSNEEIKKNVRAWDTNEWKNELEEKSSLRLYKLWRKELGGQESVYDNREASVILFKARSNNLNLGDRKRFSNQSTECLMCGDNLEDLKHFLLYCPAYDQERGKTMILQRPYQEDEEEILGKLLFEKKTTEETKTMIHRFWLIRKEKVKEQEQR